MQAADHGFVDAVVLERGTRACATMTMTDHRRTYGDHDALQRARRFAVAARLQETRAAGVLVADGFLSAACETRSTRTERKEIHRRRATSARATIWMSAK